MGGLFQCSKEGREERELLSEVTLIIENMQHKILTVGREAKRHREASHGNANRRPATATPMKRVV